MLKKKTKILFLRKTDHRKAFKGFFGPVCLFFLLRVAARLFLLLLVALLVEDEVELTFVFVVVFDCCFVAFSMATACGEV